MKLQGLAKLESNQHLSKGAGLAPTAISGVSSCHSTWYLASPVETQPARWFMIMKPVYKSSRDNGEGFILSFDMGKPFEFRNRNLPAAAITSSCTLTLSFLAEPGIKSVS